MLMKTPLELAEGLQHSNEPSVSELAKAFLALEKAYGDLMSRYLKACADNVMIRHEKTFKKLAESGD